MWIWAENNHNDVPFSDGQLHGSRVGERHQLEVKSATAVDNEGAVLPTNSTLRSIDLENERQKAVETTKRARQMIRESRETMRKLSERMCLLEDDYPPKVTMSAI